MTKLSIIIPVYNEARTIKIVLDRVNNLKINGLTKEIIVVDDGSNDGTEKILKKEREKYIYVKHSKNKGKGAAVKTGLSKATGNIILIQDADLEYRFEDYPELLDPILRNEANFVLGSRHLNTSKWKTREFIDSKMYAAVLNIGGIFYTKLFNFLYGVSLTDPATMYKIFRRECIKDIIFKSNYFELDWEMVAKLIKKGNIPIEIPVSYKSRSPKEGKKIKLLRDGFLVLWAIIKFRFFD